MAINVKMKKTYEQNFIPNRLGTDVFLRIFLPKAIFDLTKMLP